MNRKFPILNCLLEENLDYNDDIDLCKTLYKLFCANSNINSFEIFVLDDDFIDYLKKNNLQDDLKTRLRYIEEHPYRDYKQSFVNSVYSEIIEPAILPIVIQNEKFENKIFDIHLLDSMRKQLSEYLEIVVNDSTADPIFEGKYTKKIWISNNIFDLNKEIFENEADFIAEVLYANNFGISDKFKKLRFDSQNEFITAFIYVIAINKVPRVVTKEFIYNTYLNNESITNFELNIDEIGNIISNELYPPMDTMTNYLIMPEEIDDVVKDWYDAQ